MTNIATQTHSRAFVVPFRDLARWDVAFFQQTMQSVTA
jgi:hypothetical protein